MSIIFLVVFMSIIYYDTKKFSVKINQNRDKIKIKYFNMARYRMKTLVMYSIVIMYAVYVVAFESTFLIYLLNHNLSSLQNIPISIFLIILIIFKRAFNEFFIINNEIHRPFNKVFEIKAKTQMRVIKSTTDDLSTVILTQDDKPKWLSNSSRIKVNEEELNKVQNILNEIIVDN